jgi:hypothetical protein
LGAEALTNGIAADSDVVVSAIGPSRYMGQPFPDG